ncbi:hypothetical protein ATH50_1420 [Haloplanus aerogenes]|uniref:Uncharacterized protein n=1 Tax=Haloplanus aerogenes TaxID=660522 RepID=A0A3M0DU35_9EURY|nr:hypothetical protein ATH50_1420 [Haloplanus aerogenes]
MTVGESTGAPVGATVVDWDREERLPVALARTLQAGGAVR